MGVPAALSGAPTDVYPAVSGSTGGPPNDITVGQQFWNPSTGHKRRLVKAGGTITPNQAVAYDTSQANNFQVVACPTGQQPDGVNDLSTATVTIGQFFWMSYGGPVVPLVAAGIAAGVSLNCNAVAGTMAAALAADVTMASIATRAASGGGGGATACWMYSG